MVVTHRATIEERAASATARWDWAIGRRAAGRVLVTDSRWLVDSSRATLDRHAPAIRGGVDDGEHTRKHLRILIERGVLPATIPRRMFVGQCLESHFCTACERLIHVGDREVEWTNPANLVLYFHSPCVEIYRALSNGHDRR